jgi:hypothetical protein
MIQASLFPIPTAVANKARKQGFSFVQWRYDDDDEGTSRRRRWTIDTLHVISNSWTLLTLEIASKRERDINILLYSTL